MKLRKGEDEQAKFLVGQVPTRTKGWTT